MSICSGELTVVEGEAHGCINAGGSMEANKLALYAAHGEDIYLQRNVTNFHLFINNAVILE